MEPMIDDAGWAGAAPQAGASPFENFNVHDVRDLISEFPLAWLSAADSAGRETSLLPLLGEYDSAGELVSLAGHMSRRNPLVAALTADPQALILFSGPQGYVSPELTGERDWAPTWNYAQLSIVADVVFQPRETEEVVDRLVERMEAGRQAPWRSEELGDRYAAMGRRIIGFRATVAQLSGRFKLGQDEKPEILRAIMDKLADPVMIRWMRRFNEGRLG